MYTHSSLQDVFVFRNGHNHDTRRTSLARNALVQNKRLLANEKKRVQELGGLALKPQAILEEFGGSDAGLCRTRTTKAISNVLFAETRRSHRNGYTVSVDIDLTVKYLLRIGASFWLYYVKNETMELRLSESDFLNNADVLNMCSGAQFKDIHVMFPGSDRLAAVFGDCVSVDSTHNMCSARFPLYLGMVGDTNGKGHIITVSVLSSETAGAVGHALQFQKERAGLTHRIILLDNDGSEFSASSNVFLILHLFCADFMPSSISVW